MKTIDDIKDKLKKLIAKEESARKVGNLAEAEAFASHIQKLLIQYELDIEDLKAHSAESTNINKELFDTAPLTGSHESDWVRYLYAACKSASFCDVIWVQGTTFSILIIGTAMNRELLHFMVASLSVRLRIMARESFKEYEGPDKRNTYIRSFLKGACSAIRIRLQLDRRHEQQMSPQVNGLVIQKDRAVQDWIDKNLKDNISLKKDGKIPASADGYQSGYEAGTNIGIQKGVNRGKGGTLLLN